MIDIFMFKQFQIMIKNNLKKYIFFYCNLWSCMTLCTAQSVEPVPASMQTGAELAALQKWSIGIGVGVTSLPSLQCTYRWNEHWAIRGEYDYLGYGYKDIPVKAKAAIDIETRMSRFVFMAHYMPFKTDKWGILAGIAIFPSKTVAGTLHLADTLFLSEAVISPDVLGTGELRLGYTTVFAPYLGLTIGRPIPAHKNSWRLDIGAYYGGKFAVKALNIDSNVFLKENESNASVLERNFNRLPIYYRIIPDIKIVWTHAL
jgi:hypothetical protein